MGKPRKPQNRGDVRSWSFLRVREQVATVRVWVYEHPRTMGAVYGLSAGLTVEHNKVTFPAIIGAASSVAAVASGLVA